jgi:hypothetical protein
LAIGNPKRTDFLPEKTFTRFQSFATKWNSIYNICIYVIQRKAFHLFYLDGMNFDFLNFEMHLTITWYKLTSTLTEWGTSVGENGG